MSSTALYDYKILSAVAEENSLPDVANFINEKQINRIALMGLNEDLLKKIIPENSILRTQMDYFIKNIIPKTNAFDPSNRNYLLKKYQRRTRTGEALNTQLKKPWPSPFVYPKQRLDKSMLKKLESEEVLTHRDTINLIQALFLELKDYIKFYATATIYEDAAKSIIEAFPYLKDNSETGFNTYRIQLKNKFKEYRRSLENPEIIDKRNKFGKRKHVNSTRRRKPNKKFENLEEADLVNDENIDCINQSGIILEDDDEEEEDEDDVSQNRDSRDDESSDGEEEGFVKKYICNTNLVIQRINSEDSTPDS